MERAWIVDPNRLSREYKAGLASFMEVAKKYVDDNNITRCPCRKCLNAYKKSLSEIEADLYIYGFSRTYKKWIFHGEEPPRIERHRPIRDFVDMSGVESTCSETHTNNPGDDIWPLLEDYQQAAECEQDDEPMETDTTDKLFGESCESLYPGCKLSSLEAIVRLMHIKVLSHWSNKSFDMLLDFLHQTFPEAKIPCSTYDSKKRLRDLGLGYEKIHACKYDCALFWKENADLEKCPVCHEPRYKINSGKGKNIPHKVLRYFPLKPRLKRLFMSRHTASDMRWHKEKRVNDGMLRHPADGEAWKHFDNIYPQFSEDCRNVRLGLASDGFNPFQSTTQSHSIWPVVLVPYNMPPWRCMKESSLIMSLLIPGPLSPGKEIDVYLRPLIDELKDLWEFGADTYDVVSGRSFKMHASVMWTINDFPAYGMLSGWSTHGYMACPVCLEDTSSMGITSKICYMGHRRLLPPNDNSRKSKLHDGKQEFREAPRRKSGEEILQQLEEVKHVSLGKNPNNVDYKRKRTSKELNWTKKSIFFELPYWSKLKIRHILDVMHIEKNIHDNVLHTLLDVSGKSKDTLKSRIDLKNLGIRNELHLHSENGVTKKPHACYVFTRLERKQFLEFLTKLKFPDGYAANISRGVNTKDGKIYGMKSHDCHVMLQRVLPIGIRPFLRKDVCVALIELSIFFQQLTSKTLSISDVDKLEEGIVLILCKLELIFPPAFFDVMVHLAVHLPHEARLAGTVGSRWMYPIERILGTYKGYVTNRAHPEGSIAEAYIVNEALTFCSMYLRGVETKFTRPERNDDNSENIGGLTIFSQKMRPIGGRDGQMTKKEELEKMHWYILINCEEIRDYRNQHMSLLECESPNLFFQRHQESFPSWFSKHLKSLRHQNSPEATDELYALACGPDPRVNYYPGCIVNGVRFLVKERDDRRKTQNSGVVVPGEHDGDIIDFYGHLSHVIVLDYIMGFKVALFKCIWYDTDPKKKGLQTDYHLTSVNTSKKWGAEDPFIFSNQAQQVYYIDDPKLGFGWKVVQRVQHRHVWDTPATDITEEELIEPDAYQQNESSDIEFTVNQDVHDEQLNRNDVESTSFHGDNIVEENEDIDYFSDLEEDEEEFQSADETDIE